jgi:hypothetical protein
LGYHITTSGICPLTSKLEAIQQIKPPKTLKQLCSLLGLIDYYHNIWKQRSHILFPLTESTKAPRGSKSFKWEEAQDKAFQEIKKLISKNTMLIFPDFNKVFEIHTDASDYQIGSVISQDQKPIAFYSKN